MTAERLGLNRQMNNNVYVGIIQMLIPFKWSGIPYSYLGHIRTRVLHTHSFIHDASKGTYMLYFYAHSGKGSIYN